jgi:hypothetical protein
MPSFNNAKKRVKQKITFELFRNEFYGINNGGKIKKNV